ncbi:hypothetical protein Tco_0736692 [Tanacetum coccineum]
MHEKTTSPRSCLRWQPTGRILKTVCLRWVPTGKIFTSSTTKVDSEPHQMVSKEDITLTKPFNHLKIPNTDCTKDHSLTQVRGNPSKPVQTRRQLATGPEIEAMQEELHQFDRLQVCELVDKPFWQERNQAKVVYGKTKG